jgi:hypothetical protein
MWYTPFITKDDKIPEFVRNGGNVIIWFSIFLSKNPIINGGPNLECVAKTAFKIKNEGYDIIHIISIGGWNTQHPDESITPLQVYTSWKNWNNMVVANEKYEFKGFDGFDWDLEGNDAQSSKYNHFSVSTLDLMGEMSTYAKMDGYIGMWYLLNC